MTDEGIGVRLVLELERRLATTRRDVAFCDLGTGGFNVLNAIAGRSRALIIDCARMGAAPGTIRRFTPTDVTSVKTLTNFSLHEGDLLQTLHLAAELGEAPETILIFGVEPARVAPGDELSECLREQIPDYVNCIARDLHPNSDNQEPCTNSRSPKDW